ncbi:hypothetical protein CTAYLR_010423 [Chrysophaeum taylorii]|uniref:SP-RING-type domain-containing protein n=1 Tax=Chrysophaeum taylorii TaxID=2483200 RepID=A0AAD7XJP4_9STRA|nr:hypothetical protein CTAYLR_010423 [Chrysophaeum taylorii]
MPRSGAVSAIKSAEAKYHEGTLNLRGKVLDLAKQVVNMKELGDEARKQTLEGLVKVLRDAIGVKLTIDAFLESLEGLPADADEGEDAVEFFDNLLETAMASKLGGLERKVENDSQYKRIQRVVRPVLVGEEDEECLIDESQEMTEASLKDPFTQKFFDKPMRSKKCGHIYSKVTVDSYFSTQKDCVIPGCNYKLLGSRDFERDAETEVAIQRFLKSQEAGATQAVEEDEDDDL